MKSILIYRGWKRDILSLMVPNLSPWFDTEGSQSLTQSGHHDLRKLLQKGWLGWPLWGGATATMATISQNGPHWVIVKCQAIICVQVLSNLVARWSIKCLEKKATRVVFLGKMWRRKWIVTKMTLFLVKFILVFRFMISQSYTPNWVQTFNFPPNVLQFYPWISASFSFWSLVLDLCKLTLNWPLNFQFSLNSPLISSNFISIVRSLLQNDHWLWISLI